MVDRLIAIGIVPIIVPGGVIRKKELKSNPFRFVNSTISSALKLRKFMREADIIYINTIVYLSSYLAGATLSPNKYCWVHIREIPSPLISRIFLIVFVFGRFRRIYNSFQTRKAFKDASAAVVYNGVGGPLRVHALDSIEPVLKVLLIGRISTCKGHEFAMEALDIYLRYPEFIELIIVGSAYQGYEYLVAELKKFAKKCKIQTSFHSFTTDPSDFFMYSDLVLVPSTSPESFGRVAIEAFSYGKPVVAANHGGLTEIVTHGETGYLFEPNNHQALAKYIQKYLEKDIGERQKISLNARKRYEKFFSEKQYTKSVEGLLLAE